jgi:GNAT superfamily N-acetyltransferase
MPPIIPFLQKGLADGSYRGWLACADNGQVVAGGGVVVYKWPTSPDYTDPHRAYIIDVYTAPAYRRCGIARRIMETIIDWCRAEGFRSVSLHASPYGRPLYESLGFEPTNEMRLSLEEA